MSFLLRLWAIFLVAVKRLISQRGLALAVLLGLAAAVALVMSIPLYADAVYLRTFEGDLAAAGDGIARPPYAFLVRYVGSWHGYQEWEDLVQVDEYLSDQGERALGLPEQFIVRHFKTPFYVICG